jgi:hypothetical protein
MAFRCRPPAIATLSWVAGAALAAAGCGVGAKLQAAATSAGTGGATASSGAPEQTGDDAPARKGPHLVVPAVIDLPYVVAGAGGVSATVSIGNDGDAPLTGLAWLLDGDPSIALGAAPTSIDPGEQAELTLTWTGSATETITQASLAVALPAGEATLPVFAVAGDPGLGTAVWDDVAGAGGVIAGTGATVAMPAAPFPLWDGTTTFTDPSVRVFLAEGYRDRGAQDMVLHFHGWNTTLASTLATHLYQEHVYASGSNAVLVVPQGPVNAPSSDFGKLMTRGGLARLFTEVLVLLYREGKIAYPVRGDVAITSHSGGYLAVAASLDPTNQGPKIAQVNLFDSLYGYEAIFESFALGGGTLRSNYSESGGTFDQNQGMAAYLGQRGMPAAAAPTQRARRDDAPIVDLAATTHDGTTRLLGAYGEDLRWKLRHSRRGPRIELRQVVAAGGTATARWLAPADEDVTGFVVETSTDGATWATAATVGASASEASFALSGRDGGPASGARVRVKATTTGVDPAQALPSDTYRVDAGAKVLVVDGFDRRIDGAFGGLDHDFAAVIGEATGKVASVSHHAVTEDGFDLTAWPAVVWVLGDQSTADVSLSAAEQTALLDYVDGGGHLVMTGSELGYDIGQTPEGAMFLDHCFGAMFVADDAESFEVAGAGNGPLREISSFAFGGPGAPYPAISPDVLGATPGGQVLLEYGTGQAAAVGLPGKGALVGFQLELVGAAHLGAVARALLSFAGG